MSSLSYIISVPSWVPYWSSFSSNSRMYYSIREHFKHTLRTTQWPLSGEHVLFPLSMQDYRYVRWTNSSPSLACGGNSSHLHFFVHETSFNSSAGHSENSFMQHFANLHFQNETELTKFSRLTWTYIKVILDSNCLNSIGILRLLDLVHLPHMLYKSNAQCERAP